MRTGPIAVGGGYGGVRSDFDQEVSAELVNSSGISRGLANNAPTGFRQIADPKSSDITQLLGHVRCAEVIDGVTFSSRSGGAEDFGKLVDGQVAVSWLVALANLQVFEFRNNRRLVRCGKSRAEYTASRNGATTSLRGTPVTSSRIRAVNRPNGASTMIRTVTELIRNLRPLSITRFGGRGSSYHTRIGSADMAEGL